MHSIPFTPSPGPVPLIHLAQLPWPLPHSQGQPGSHGEDPCGCKPHPCFISPIYQSLYDVQSQAYVPMHSPPSSGPVPEMSYFTINVDTAFHIYLNSVVSRYIIQSSTRRVWPVGNLCIKYTYPPHIGTYIMHTCTFIFMPIHIYIQVHPHTCIDLVKGLALHNLGAD